MLFDQVADQQQRCPRVHCERQVELLRRQRGNRLQGAPRVVGDERIDVAQRVDGCGHHCAGRIRVGKVHVEVVHLGPVTA